MQRMVIKTDIIDVIAISHKRNTFMRLIILIIFCIALLTCNSRKCYERHKVTVIVPTQYKSELYRESYQVSNYGDYGGSVRAYYLTDSLRFRICLADNVQDKEKSILRVDSDLCIISEVISLRSHESRRVLRRDTLYFAELEKRGFCPEIIFCK